MRRQRSSAALAAGLCLLLAACSQPAAPTATRPPVATSAPTTAPPTLAPTSQPTPTTEPTSPPTTQPEPDQGMVLLEERCTRCHSLDRVFAQQKDEAGWRTTVERMVSRGAELSQEELELLVSYLTEEYGP